MCKLTGILDLIFCQCLCVQSVNQSNAVYSGIGILQDMNVTERDVKTSTSFGIWTNVFCVVTEVFFTKKIPELGSAQVPNGLNCAAIYIDKFVDISVVVVQRQVPNLSCRRG